MFIYSLKRHVIPVDKMLNDVVLNRDIWEPQPVSSDITASLQASGHCKI